MLVCKYPKQHDRLFDLKESRDDTLRTEFEKIGKWLNSGFGGKQKTRPLPILKDADLTTMTQSERQELYQFWLRAVREPIKNGIMKLLETYHETKLDRDWVREGPSLRNLQLADIVGVPITGIAKRRTLLERVGFRVMLVEEASEMLEAHMLAALLPSLDHLIMIDDHKQLRPKIQSYNLQSTRSNAKNHALDISMFERFVEPPPRTGIILPYTITLDTQRRMHPVIADLTRLADYPFLRDSDNVLSFPNVAGMKERLFWFHHEHSEANVKDRRFGEVSHYNDFEAEMVLGLARHLARQPEYSKAGVTILTPYRGQLQKILLRIPTAMKIRYPDLRIEQSTSSKDSDDISGSVPLSQRRLASEGPAIGEIKLSTIDNFQGEEETIVIISLVRSNPQRDCGFLRSSNRINVMLSRARHGLYIVGNSETYGNVPMWAGVISLLKSRGQFGNKLDILCRHNPKTHHSISGPEDFCRCTGYCGTNPKRSRE